MKFTNLSRTAFAIGAAMFVLVQCGPNPNPNGVTDTVSKPYPSSST